MISLIAGVDSVRQLNNAPEAVAARDILSNTLPVIGQRFTTPSERYNIIINAETPAVRIPLASALMIVAGFI
jgi:hypothetical protein